MKEGIDGDADISASFFYLKSSFFHLCWVESI